MKRIGTILICIGIIIAVSPLIGELYMNHKREQLYNQYINDSSPECIELDNNIDLYQNREDEIDTTKLIEVKDTKEIQETHKPEETFKIDYSETKSGEVIGKVIIPSIEVDMLIVEGESDENLSIGAGHILHTAYPGEEGNCVLAGHRNYTFGSMFNRLGEVVLGDEIYIDIKGVEFTYAVDEIEIIEPTNLDILGQPKDEKRITLLTCHPINIGNKRLLVKGQLIE